MAYSHNIISFIHTTIHDTQNFYFVYNNKERKRDKRHTLKKTRREKAKRISIHVSTPVQSEKLMNEINALVDI